RSTRQSFGLHLFSHSSLNQVKGCAPSGYSENAFSLIARQYGGRLYWQEEAGYAFDLYHCYGYNADSLDKLYNWSQKASDIARHYHRVHAAVKGYTPSTKTSLLLNRHYEAGYNLLYDNFHSYEHRAILAAGLDKRLMSSRLDMLRIEGGLGADYIHNYWDTSKRKIDAWIFRASPAFRLEEGNWRLKAGLSVSAGLENGEMVQTMLFPDLYAHLDIVPEILSVYAGAKGDVSRDAYGLLSLDNPFLAPEQNLAMERYFSIYAGTRTNLSNSLIFGARIGLEKHSGLAFYLPDTSLTALNDTTVLRLYNTFTVNHAPTFLTHAHLDVTYKFREVLRVMGNLDYYSYNTDDSVTLYYLPQYSISLSADYLWKKKIRFGVDWAWRGGLFAPVYGPGNVMDKASLPDWVDVSLNAEYIWNRRFRLFAELNNLLGRRNQRYANYYTERFNCLFGLKYVFGGE
ncbi:MAG: TonB-dependent receptor, partial [Bacteroidales bacterium]|nr:TonB-dependent receptor [Bacteroidales bacterium]